MELYPTGLLAVATGTGFTFSGLAPKTFYEVGITPMSPATRNATPERASRHDTLTAQPGSG